MTTEPVNEYERLIASLYAARDADQRKIDALVKALEATERWMLALPLNYGASPKGRHELDAVQAAMRLANDAQPQSAALAGITEAIAQMNRAHFDPRTDTPADPVRKTLEDIAKTPKHGEPDIGDPAYHQNWEENLGEYAIERLHDIIDEARAAIAKGK